MRQLLDISCSPTHCPTHYARCNQEACTHGHHCHSTAQYLPHLPTTHTTATSCPLPPPLPPPPTHLPSCCNRVIHRPRCNQDTSTPDATATRIQLTPHSPTPPTPIPQTTTTASPTASLPHLPACCNRVIHRPRHNPAVLVSWVDPRQLCHHVAVNALRVQDRQQLAQLVPMACI